MCIRDRGNGAVHLANLAEAGVTHLHLLPTFDIATINEVAAERTEPDRAELAALPADSDQQQALIGEVRDLDAFNWGYDPLHYNVPEGSYSTDPDGVARILEYRQMVQALNSLGLRVVAEWSITTPTPAARPTTPSSTVSCPATTIA